MKLSETNNSDNDITLKARFSHFSNHFQDDLNLNQWDRLPNHWSNRGYDISSQSQRVSREPVKRVSYGK